MNEPVQNTKLRRPSLGVKAENVTIGGVAPVVVQSMTDTDTVDVERTVRQVLELSRAGSELVRLTVNTDAAARAVPKIRERLLKSDADVPLIGDFHFNGHRLLERNRNCAEALAKWRINPGNLGRKNRHDAHFSRIIELACELEKPIRIGVNWGSLDAELLAKKLDENAARKVPQSLRAVTRTTVIESALTSAAYARKLGLPADRIVLSCKTSNVQDLQDVYRRLAAACSYPLHLGLTEAGVGLRSIVATTAALAPLLSAGIGDTIRVSLTPEPGGKRSREVDVAQEILQSLELRAFIPTVIACPGCGRTTSEGFRKLAVEVRDYIDQKMPVWRASRPGVEEMTVAVMGCVVNGPGESKHADIGISLPGTGESPSAQIFEDGVRTTVLEGNRISDDFKALIENYVSSRYRNVASN